MVGVTRVVRWSLTWSGGGPGDPGGSGGPGDPGGPGGQCFALITYLVDIVCPHQRLGNSPGGRAQGCWGMCA